MKERRDVPSRPTAADKVVLLSSFLCCLTLSGQLRAECVYPMVANKTGFKLAKLRCDRQVVIWVTLVTRVVPGHLLSTVKNSKSKIQKCQCGYCVGKYLQLWKDLRG